MDNSNTTSEEKTELQKVIDTSNKQINELTTVKDTLSSETSAGIFSSPTQENIAKSVVSARNSLKNIVATEEKKVDTNLFNFMDV